MSHNRPETVVIDKKENECHIVDVAHPVGSRICLKEHEKEEKYIDLAFEIKRLWRLHAVRITPIITGALITFSNNQQKYLEDLHIGLSIQSLQKSVPLGSEGIFRRTLEAEVVSHYLLIGNTPVAITVI